MTSQAQAIVITNERVTGPPGVQVLKLSRVADHDEVDALDLACGGGIITSELLQSSSNIKRIVAGDIDDQMLSFVTEKRDNEINKSPDSSWSLVEVSKINQTTIPHPEATFTHVFNNFGIFFLPDDSGALADIYRVLKPAGQAGFTSWKSIAWWAAVADPALAKHLPEAPKLPSPSVLFAASGWSDEDAIKTRLAKPGFRDVQVSEYKFAPRIEAAPFAQATALLVQGIAKRVWSEEVFEKFAGKIEGAMFQYLEEIFDGGVWDGEMTAIVSLGTK